MDRAAFDGLTDRLVAWASDAPGVLGLLLVGSAAGTTHEPDGWSDHDFFVIAEPAVAPALRASAAWLPVPQGAIVLHEQDTAHGAWAVLDDGHLLEYAVFAPDELALSRSGALRVAVDRLGDLEARMAPTLAPPRRDPASIASALLRAALVGAGRAARGERLVGRRHLGDAAGALLALLALEGAPDALDPWRRVEQHRPAIAAALDRELARGDASAASAFVALAADLFAHEPWWPRALADAVRPRIEAAGRPRAAGG
ncbi:hypothetical protein OVA14_02685 [Agrococcus sp. SL85]|uniref:hypothetical protein n=1 Tax=Agrococcus sp. SL85 TaxID=2995141 RepID=UPI00226C8551|nr:hypothetical protein [Agrococcus sp. SL85]WAC66701.1 hypothetical protein OVA14_02685 [Agrococcus sp. SL85]